MKKIVLLIIVSLFLGGCSGKITNLSAPTLKSLDKINVGKDIAISGSGYPNAKLMLFINGEYKEDLPIYTNGNFSGKIALLKDGENNIKTKQTIQGIVSDFSNEIVANADMTPPEPNLKISSVIPKITNKKEIVIAGTTEKDSYLLINNENVKPDEGGNFSYKFNLIEGINDISLALEDEFKNKTETLKEYKVNVDTVPPKIYTGYCPLFTKDKLGKTEEYLCINTGEWRGWGGSASVPITGESGGEFKTITVEGKIIKPDENNQIFQRIWLATPYGLNKYKVVAEDMMGNKSSAYLEMNVVNLDEQTNDTPSSCCKYCDKGKACGDSCISRSYECHQPPGCACDL